MNQNDMRKTSYNRNSDRYASAYRQRRDTYENGSAVRRAQTAPKRQPERVPVRTREEELRRRQHAHAAKRNRQNALLMNKRYVIFLAAATVICAMVCGMYIYMQASMAMNMRQISNLETQISELKTTNDASEKRLDTAMDLETVKEKAQKDLGMSYAGSDQIVYYSVDSADYMNQYGSVN